MIKEKSSCPCCHEEDNSKLAWELIDADGNSQEGHYIIVCSRCGTGITSPKPDPDELSRFYSQGIYAKRGGRFASAVNLILNWLQANRLSQIDAYSTEHGRILDLGCGKGRFLKVANSKGWSVYGQDVTKSQIDAAQDGLNFPVWEGDLVKAGFEDGFFQTVTAWHVLEHVADVEELMQEVRRITQKGGVFALEVPNFGSWQAQLGRGKWFQLDVPRHLHYFTIRGLVELIGRNGFQVREISTWSIELGPFGLLQSVLNRMGCVPQVLFLSLKRMTMKNGKKWLGTVFSWVRPWHSLLLFWSIFLRK